VEHNERAVLSDPPEGRDSANGCPPEFLLRAAVLRPDKSILSHVAHCPRCAGAYRSARSSGCPDAPPATADRAANWIARLAGSVQPHVHAPAAPGAKRPAGLRNAMGGVK